MPSKTDKPAAARGPQKQTANRRTGRGASGKFLPGNSYGKRWKAGESGNPSGRRGSLADALRRRLSVVRDDSDGRTNAELVADMLFEQAIEHGDIRAAREIIDRTEGRPPLAVEIEVGDERREFYEALITELCAEYNLPRERVVEDILRRKPEAARWIER